MTATTREGFTTVSQSGSFEVWTGVSNLAYPTEGEASVYIPEDATGRSNLIMLAVPQEAAGIPVGAKFDSMSLVYQQKKEPEFFGVDVVWRTSVRYGTAFVSTQTTSNAYESETISGSKSYWGLGSYTDTEVITKLKDGTLFFMIYATPTTNDSVIAYIQSATIVINYTTVEGEGASLIAAIL